MAVAADLHRDFLIPAPFFAQKRRKMISPTDPCYSFVLLV